MLIWAKAQFSSILHYIDWIEHNWYNFPWNKKVLLRECKRHTARRVASTPYVVLTWVPPLARSAWGGGYLTLVPPWVPPRLTWPGGTWPGYPPDTPPADLARGGTWPAGYPPPPGRVPPGRVPPQAGYPPSWTWQGNPAPRWLPHGILGNVAKHYGIWVLPCWLPHGILGNVAKHYGIWVPPPPPRCGQTENITFPILRMRTLKISCEQIKKGNLILSAVLLSWSSRSGRMTKSVVMRPTRSTVWLPPMHVHMCKYVDVKGWAAMLAAKTAKESAGVTQEVNLRNPNHISEGFPLVLKPRAEISRSRKEGY